MKLHVSNVIFNPTLTCSCPLVISNGHGLSHQQQEAVTLPKEVALQPSVEVSEATHPVILLLPHPYSNIQTPSPNNQAVPSSVDLPIQKNGGCTANSGASVLVTTEPPSYRDAIEKY